MDATTSSPIKFLSSIEVRLNDNEETLSPSSHQLLKILDNQTPKLDLGDTYSYEITMPDNASKDLVSPNFIADSLSIIEKAGMTLSIPTPTPVAETTMGISICGNKEDGGDSENYRECFGNDKVC